MGMIIWHQVQRVGPKLLGGKINFRI